MKKLLSVLLAAAMLLSCCTVFAEEETQTIDFSVVEFQKITEEESGAKVAIKDESSYAIAPISDSVTVSGSMIAVRTRGLTMMLNLPDAYVCFTQDYFASLQSYAMLSDPDPLQNFMVQADSHFYLYDQYTQNESHIDSLQSDKACAMIGNLRYLDDENLKAFAAAFGEANDVTAQGFYKTGTAVWIKYTGVVNVYITIVGSEYLAYFYGNAEDTDAQEILSALTVFG